jgi:hypothetical protein
MAFGHAAVGVATDGREIAGQDGRRKECMVISDAEG